MRLVDLPPCGLSAARPCSPFTRTAPGKSTEISRLRGRAGFESGGALRPTNVKAMQRALETAGVIWIEAKDGGPSARLREPRDSSVAD
jgi:hypothetical protein